MGNIFSKSLQKYFTRKGNRIVFLNGMSLNQLALEMSEGLGFREVDASVISRVLTGERILTQQQLSVFCKIMNLKKSEEKYLRLSLHSEIYSRFQGRFLLDINTDQFLEMAEGSVIMIREANEKGASILALQWAIDIEEKLKNEIVKTTDKIAILKLYDLLFDTLEQHSTSILRREMPDEALKHTWPVLEKMGSIAKELKSRKKIGLTYAKMGDVLSLVGGLHGTKSVLERSTKLLRKSLDFIDPKLLIYPLEYAMLNESYLKDEKEFEELKGRVYKVIPLSAYSDGCEAYNLIAKSKINLGQTGGLEQDFIKGWDNYNKIPDLGRTSKIFRKVQLSRTEIQGATSGFKLRNLSELKHLIMEGLFASKEFGYMRYFNTTREMLTKSQESLEVDFNFDN